ncbi:MAG TPA: hypothetical protein VF715_13100, partial [Thermoleophilaceae bacterium]
MAGVAARLTAGRLLALYVAVAATLPAAFWPLRDVPEGYGCDPEPPGQEAAREAFQAGAIPLHAVAALVLLAALCAWSARRHGGHVGGATALAASLAFAYLALMLAWNDAFLPLAVLAYFAGIFAMPVVALAGVVALVVIRLRRPQWAESTRFV